MALNLPRLSYLCPYPLDLDVLSPGGLSGIDGYHLIRPIDHMQREPRPG